MLLATLLLATRLGSGVANVDVKQPQIAANGNTVALTYGSGNAVYFSISRDGAATFSKPVKIAQGAHLFLGRHRGPRIVLTKDAIVISTILADKRPGAGNLFAWRSTDEGKTWSQAIRLNDTAESAREGLHGMAANAHGLVFATWLDLRSKGMKLYGALSKDGGATWGPNRLVYASPDGHICECCHPSAAVSADGTIFAMWRNWLGGSRDMYLGTSRDGGVSFKTTKLGSGTWRLNACPMDGGGLVLDAKGAPVTAWRREQAVYLALPGQSEIPLGKGKDVSLAAGRSGQVYAAWSQGMAITAKIPGKNEAVTLAPHGAFVQLAGDGPVYAAWEKGPEIVIEKLPD